MNVPAAIVSIVLSIFIWLVIAAFDEVRDAEQDSHVRVLILTGTGKMFSAGGDLRRMRESDIPPVERYKFIPHEFGGLIQEGST